MTPKDAFLETVVGHGKTPFVPNAIDGSVVYCGGRRETFENGPFEGGEDGFGVLWHCTDSGGGQPVPVPGHEVLEDIEDWRDVVKFPDLDAYDWEGEAALQLANVDRKTQIVEYQCWNSQFLRVTDLMGFMNGICAFAEEPELSMELLDAITDYKIRLVERVAHYFKPDFITHFDDVATQSSLFLSPEMYRMLIKPQHKRLNDAIKSHGIYPMVHTCGKCEALIGDYIEEGSLGWSSAQPVNDIEGIIQRYGDKITVLGGFDSNGPPGRMDATDELLDQEVRRCMRQYGGKGGYVFLAFRIMDTADPEAAARAIAPVVRAAEKYKYLDRWT